MSPLLRYSKMELIKEKNWIDWNFLSDHKLLPQTILPKDASDSLVLGKWWGVAFWHYNILNRQIIICILLKTATKPMQDMGCEACHQNILIKQNKKHYLIELSVMIIGGTRPEKVTSYVNKGFLYKSRICFTAGHNYNPSAPLSLPTVIAEVNILHLSKT